MVHDTSTGSILHKRDYTFVRGFLCRRDSVYILEIHISSVLDQVLAHLVMVPIDGVPTSRFMQWSLTPCILDIDFGV